MKKGTDEKFAPFFYSYGVARRLVFDYRSHKVKRVAEKADKVVSLNLVLHVADKLYELRLRLGGKLVVVGRSDLLTDEFGCVVHDVLV